MKKKHQLIYLVFFGLSIFLVLTNYSQIINYNQSSISLWLNKLLPSLFPFLVLGSILIKLNIASFFKSSSLTLLLLSLFSGFPSGAKYIKDMYNSHLITLKEANQAFAYTFFANPLFLLGVLSFLPFKLAIIIIISHYLPNILLFLFLRNSNHSNKNIKPESLGNIISISVKESINTMFLILGTLIFYNIFISFFKIYSPSVLITIFFSCILEFSSCLSNLPILNSPLLCAILALIFTSFGSLSIHSQIKSIIIDTPLSYKQFCLYRLFHAILSIIIFFVFYVFI